MHGYTTAKYPRQTTRPSWRRRARSCAPSRARAALPQGSSTRGRPGCCARLFLGLFSGHFRARTHEHQLAGVRARQRVQQRRAQAQVQHAGLVHLRARGRRGVLSTLTLPYPTLTPTQPASAELSTSALHACSAHADSASIRQNPGRCTCNCRGRLRAGRASTASASSGVSAQCVKTPGSRPLPARSAPSAPRDW